MTPEDETKLLIRDVDTQQQPIRDDDDDDDDIKRRSSAGTYSLSSDSQPDCANSATGAQCCFNHQQCNLSSSLKLYPGSPFR